MFYYFVLTDYCTLRYRAAFIASFFFISNNLSRSVRYLQTVNLKYQLAEPVQWPVHICNLPLGIHRISMRWSEFVMIIKMIEMGVA